MVELGDVGDRLESLLKVGNLLELATKLDNRGATEFSGSVHGQNTVLKVVELGLDEEKITVSQFSSRPYTQTMSTYEQDFTGKNRDRGTLMPMAESKCCMKSAKCWDILTNVASHLNSGTDGSFKLDNGLASISNLVVDNDFKTERILVHDPLDGSQITPNVVGVDYSGLAFTLIHRMAPTDLEFSSAAELIKVILGNLRNLEQPRLAIVVNDGTTLDVGLGLVSDLHNVFGLSVNHGLEDVEIDDSTKIVDIGDEDVLLACSDELVKKARVAGEDINHNPIKPVPRKLTSKHRRCHHVREGTSCSYHWKILEDKEAEIPCQHEGIEID